MKSRYSEDWDSGTKDNDDDDVYICLVFHKETELMGANLLNDQGALDPNPLPSPRGVAAKTPEGINPYNLPPKVITELLEWRVCVIQKPIPKGSSKADQETALHLSQNNLRSVHLHLLLHSTGGSRFRIHEVISIEGIVHLRGLAL